MFSVFQEDSNLNGLTMGAMKVNCDQKKLKNEYYASNSTN